MSDQARDAILRDLEATENALKGAQEVYAKDERSLHEAQNRAQRSYDARAEISRRVDRLRTALAIVEGDDRDPIVAELNRQGGSPAVRTIQRRRPAGPWMPVEGGDEA